MSKTEPEPLKGKTQSHYHRTDKTDRHDVHDDVDIRSAMKWFEEKLISGTFIPIQKQGKEYYCIEQIRNVLKQAFEDIKGGK